MRRQYKDDSAWQVIMRMKTTGRKISLEAQIMKYESDTMGVDDHKGRLKR